VTAAEKLLLENSRRTPYNHQIVGVMELFADTNEASGRVIPNCLAIFDEMGAGKTKQVIDAAMLLYIAGKIDRVVVVCPASVRSVWYDPEYGQLRDHMWTMVPALVTEYHSKFRQWRWGKDTPNKLKWIITNYDYIRNEDHLNFLKAHVGKKTLLVVDESSAIKSPKAAQSKAVMALRIRCGRVVILNGTPTSQGPGDLYFQAQVMDPRILQCKTWFNFRARYGVLGGYMGKQVVSWTNLEDLQRRMAPYVLRRLKEDCLDLPEKLPPQVITITLKESTWKIYDNMRQDMVAWLNTSEASIAQQAIVKAMRLSQITSGFLGGVEDLRKKFDDGTDAPDWMEQDPLSDDWEDKIYSTDMVREIGDEKLTAFMSWFHDRLFVDPNFKVLVWCRYRHEVARVVEALKTKYHELGVGEIRGGQSRDDRNFALRLLDPVSAPTGPAVVVGTPKSGSMGLNLTASHTVIYMSNDYSLMTRQQSEDRVHRPPQRNVVEYFDMVAVGPNGQKTIDHTIIKALRDKFNLAKLTTSAWVTELTEE